MGVGGTWHEGTARDAVLRTIVDRHPGCSRVRDNDPGNIGGSAQCGLGILAWICASDAAQTDDLGNGTTIRFNSVKWQGSSITYFCAQHYMQRTVGFGRNIGEFDEDGEFRQ